MESINVTKLFDSTEQMKTANYKAGCGHTIDARQGVYIHYTNGIDTSCPDCCKDLQAWPE